MFEMRTAALLNIQVFCDVKLCKSAWPWTWRHYDPTTRWELVKELNSVTYQDTWN